ncbi:hypothetical protein PYCCODRAFT_1220097 [Trametes coccinea BRFM310]|uniref:FAD-binding domain-containing protein n=1 Tax=Trametes coccinea (strain BRFM310) TaxID=1353009 RepID=A0A1Y2IXC7_TRAC3|nr:hypothetical protein PYCCODRAFT_1220097 [Trametes coccinea BRFM310]
MLVDAGAPGCASSSSDDQHLLGCPPFARTQDVSKLSLSNGFASTSTHQESDVVIVGGGPAGLALATALSSNALLRSTLKVVLVEAGDLSKVANWTQPAGTYSNRVSSITNASQSFLQEIRVGAWAHVEEGRTCPIEEMQIWDGVSDTRPRGCRQ